MKVERWGDSLAVRIPADVLRELGLREGDAVDLRKLHEGHLVIERRPEALVERDVDPERRAEALERMRALATPLPADYRFNREDANAR